jgi:hypothetical protein
VPVELISQIPATVGASSTWTSTLIAGDGYGDLVIGVTLSQNGNLKVQRYIDDLGAVALAAADTAALSAATPGVLIVTDGKPYASYTVSIQNTGASTGNVSGFAVLMSAH